MKKMEYAWKSALHAFCALLYISGISWVMFNSAKLFPKEDNFLMPVLFLLLFVISAAITSFLVLGKPVMLYLSNSKKEAFIMLFATLGWLAIFAIAIILFLISM